MAMTQAKKAEVMERFTKCYSAAQSKWSTIHDEALEDKRFIQLGEQDAENEDKNSGRAKIRVNRMLGFTKQVTNEMRQTNIGIQVVPVDNGADIEKAKVRQGVIRGIERQCNARFAYQYAGEEQVVSGLGAFRVVTQYVSDKSFEQTIAVKRILDATTVFYGPANEPDFSDAEYCIVRGNGSGVKEGDASYSTLKNYSVKEKDVWGDNNSPNEFEFWLLEKTKDKLYQFTNGRYIFASQVNADADQSLFIQKDGKRMERETVRRKWCCYKLKAGDVIEETEWLGKWCPIVLVLGREVWVDGERHLLSLCRYSKDAQRMYNYARSASAERMGMGTKAPWVVAIESIPEKFKVLWQNVHRKAVGMLPYNAFDTQNRPLPPPQRPQAIGVDPAIVQEQMTAAEELKATTGIYDAGLGNRSNETSGVAIRARKSESDVSTYDYQDNLSIAVRHCGRIINDLVPKVIDTKRQVRMVGEDESDSVITVNEASDTAERDYGSRDAFYLSEEEEYDIAVEVGASYATKRQENSENLLELMRVAPIAAQALPNLYVGQLEFNMAQEAKKQIERLMEKTTPGVVEPEKGKEAPMPPQAIQAIQQAEQLQTALTQMAEEMKAMKADKSLEAAKLQLEGQKAQMDNMVKKFDSMTKRMDVIGSQKIAEGQLVLSAQTAQAGNDGPSDAPESRNQDME